MRPRPDAAENKRISVAQTAATPGFNEAAARCRGKHGFRGKLADIPRRGLQ